MNYQVLHGTPNPDIIFSFENNRVAFFTDNRETAERFAEAKDSGGLFEGEKATIIHAEITIYDPLFLNEDDWERLADSTVIDKKTIMADGYDGVICKNDYGVTYYVIFNESQIKIINKETK